MKGEVTCPACGRSGFVSRVQVGGDGSQMDIAHPVIYGTGQVGGTCSLNTAQVGQLLRDTPRDQVNNDHA